MALNKNTNTCSNSSLALLVLVLFSIAILASHARTLPNGTYTTITVHGRNLLSRGNGSSKPKVMVDGAVTPSSEIHDDKGTMIDVDRARRPSFPGHSPGIGHSFINKNGPGRKL
jgi:hypothetical protein